jgi:hypothetical protein
MDEVQKLLDLIAYGFLDVAVVVSVSQTPRISR